MQRNPDTPPADAISNESPVVVPRPLSVWLLLIILAAGTCVLVIGVCRLAWFVISVEAKIVNYGAAAYPFVWRISLACLCGFTLYNAYKRQKSGRWLGVLAILGLAIWNLSMPDYIIYPNKAQESGALVGRYAVTPALFAWWVYAYGFSVKARKYFSSTSSEA